MTTKRYDVCAPRPGREEGKTFWHRLGTAFEGDKGIGIIFDSLPLPDKDGRVTVRLFEPREKSTGSGAGGAGQESAPAGRRVSVSMNDDIPFAPEWR